MIEMLLTKIYIIPMKYLLTGQAGKKFDAVLAGANNG
jgi:hypothetical protein